MSVANHHRGTLDLLIKICQCASFLKTVAYDWSSSRRKLINTIENFNRRCTWYLNILISESIGIYKFYLFLIYIQQPNVQIQRVSIGAIFIICWMISLVIKLNHVLFHRHFADFFNNAIRVDELLGKF